MPVDPLQKHLEDFGSIPVLKLKHPVLKVEGVLARSQGHASMPLAETG